MSSIAHASAHVARARQSRARVANARPGGGGASASSRVPARRLATRASAEDVTDPWIEERRSYLSALTVEKGLKPLCRGYGLKLGGSKTALLERVLAHERDHRADIAPMEEVIARATEWRKSRVVRVDEEAVKTAAAAREAKRERAGSAGGWTRDAEDDGEDFEDDSGWGSQWARYEDEEESTTARLREIEGRYPDLLRPADERVSKDDLARRVAVVNGLRELAKEKSGYEADTGMQLDAIARAIARSYRDMRGSALSVLQKEARARLDVSVDIDVERGRFAVLVQVYGRSGAVEREYDDTKFFTFNIRRKNRMRPLIRFMSEEMKTGVARAATEEYVGQIGNVVRAKTRFRSEDGSWMVDIDDGAAGVIPANEQLELVNGNQLRQGDEVTCFVLDVDSKLFTGREQTPVVLSMTIPALVPGVIREEVPEIQDGLVEIKSVARLSGKLSKVTVTSTDLSAVDAVSVCVGEGHDRLRRIRERCGGEIIQFIRWSDDEEEIIKGALFPAHVTRVEKSFPEGSNRPKYTAFVSEFDLRRAIGAGGANVKLCAALTNAFVVVEVDEDVSNAPRRRAFNADLDDSFGGGGGFWGDEREDEGFDARDAEQFVNVMNNDRFGERRDGVALDDLCWPDLDDDFDDLPTLAPRPDDIDRPASSASASSSSSTVTELKTLDEALASRADASTADTDADADAIEEWEVGPGRPGLVAFGAAGRPGVVGAALFFGDAFFDDDDDDIAFE